MNKIMEERKRCPFFHFFAKTNEKRPTTKRDQTTKKVDSSHDLMISFLYSHSHTHPKHKAEEEEDEEDEEEDEEERETTALLFIRVSFCLVFLNRYHRLSKW
jgi:CO dehydrogenase/acetyl-CoA synthase beta subunit